MNVKRFVAGNSREALQAVKRELGAEAVILSNRTVDGGVEIMAMAGDALRAAEPVEAARSKRAAVPGATRPAGGDAAAAPGQAWADGIVQEIRAMRDAIEEQLVGLAWSDLQQREPGQARLLRELLGRGFSPGLARLVASNLPAGMDAARGMDWLERVLARNIGCAAEDQLVADGGIYALLGPTGVGKTTTVAKIAARAVVRHGAEGVALVTTDTYRIGAHEQLRIYARILGIPVHTVAEEQDLRAILGDLQGRRLVLIDTVGMGQRDERVAAQVAMLAGGMGKVSRILLLAASASADTLDEVVRAYRGEHGLAGAILTKLDEAVSLGAVLDVLIRYRLKLQYVADGQRVPEDLHAPDPAMIARQALARGAHGETHALGNDDVAAALAMVRPAMPALGALARS